MAQNGSIKPLIAFIGGGKIVSAISDGFVASGKLTKDDIAISVKSQTSLKSWNERGYKNVYVSNADMMMHHGNGVIFLAVKPDVRSSVLNDLDFEHIHPYMIVSLMATVDLKSLKNELCARGYNGTIVRMMPNIAVAVLSGMTVFAVNDDVEDCRINYTVQLMKHVGDCIQINEKYFDVATAIVGSSPAFIFCAIEALADGCVLEGLDRTTAFQLVSNTVLGAAKMVLHGEKHPALLKDDVCSPGGVTVHGLRELEKSGFRSNLIEAIHVMTKRSGNQSLE